MDEKSITAIILSPQQKNRSNSLKNNRSSSFQRFLQNIDTEKTNKPDSKYKQFKTEKPKPKGLFKLLENSPTQEIIFLTSLEPTQKYIALLENIEFIITKNHEHQSRIIFNLVDLEKVIFNQKNLENLIKLSEPYEQLQQENNKLREIIEQQKKSFFTIQKKLTDLNKNLTDAENENKINKSSLLTGLALFFTGFGLNWLLNHFNLDLSIFFNQFSSGILIKK